MEVNETKAELNAGTIYDVNKQLVDQEKEMSNSKKRELKNKLKLWFNDHKNKYAMLLNNERRDYTVFRITFYTELAADECIGCLEDRGGLVSGDLTEDGAWEFWIHLPEGGSAVYYLFDYTNAVIEC